MAVAAPVVTGLSLGATGLQIMGGLSDAEGKAAGYRQQQDKAQRLSRSAKTAADETDAQLREELLVTLGNMNAIRSAAGQDSSSPTTLALEAEEIKQSDRQRRIKTGNLQAQAAQYDRDALYFGYAGSSALGTGYLNAFSTGIKSLAGLSKAA